MASAATFSNRSQARPLERFLGPPGGLINLGRILRQMESQRPHYIVVRLRYKRAALANRFLVAREKTSKAVNRYEKRVSVSGAGWPATITGCKPLSDELSQSPEP